MKKWLYNAERKYGNLGIDNLMLYISSTTAVVYLISWLLPQLNLLGMMSLWSGHVLRGQVWRIITFIFIPSTYSLFSLMISLYFYYYMGQRIQAVWGSFRFTLYYFVGALGIVLSSFFTGFGTVAPLNLSIFLAFAVLFPDEHIFYNFFLPIKSKYLALAYLVLQVPGFLRGGFGYKISVVVSLLNVVLFLGSNLVDVYSNDIFLIKRKLQNFFNNRRA